MSKLLISDNKLAATLNKEFAKTVNKNIPKFAKAVKPDIQELVRIFLKKHPTYKVLLGRGVGTIADGNVNLAAEFGFPKGTETEYIDPIIDTIANSVSVTSTRASVDGKKINIGINVVLYKEDFIDSLKKLETSTLTVENAKGQIHQLDWVRWLFERGTKINVSTHHIKFGNHATSRSGKAIMVPKGTWSVPGYYAGTKKSNWVTKALDPDARGGLLGQQIEGVFYKHIGILG